MKTSETINDLAAALAKAQGSLSNVDKSKTAKAGRYSYSYANIADVLDVIRAAAAGNGLSYVHSSEVMDADQSGHNLLRMKTRLLHSSGQWIEVIAHAAPVDWTCQSVGSCETYLRRYSLIKLFGVAAADAEDDDGRRAQERAPARHSAHKNEADRRIKGLWSHVGAAAKKDGYTREYNGEVKGDWRKLARAMGYDPPQDWQKVDAVFLEAILETREQRKASEAVDNA